jgi:Flp pilus assembly pilin Flp
MNFFKKRILVDQKGQGVMEYVIISSLVGIVCITAVKGFGDVIKKRIQDMEHSIVDNLKT